MSGIRLPRAAKETVKRVRSVQETPRSRLSRVLKFINPIHKEMVQRKLFVEQHIKGLDNTELLKTIDVDPVLRKELENIYEQPVKKIDYKGHGRSSSIVPENINLAIKSLRASDILRSHKYYLNTSSVMILFQDMSHTKTNKMYHSTVVNKIKALSSQADLVTTNNMDSNTLQRMLPKNENLVRELKLLKSETPVLKALCIPPHAIDLTGNIFDIVRSRSPQFQIIGVLFNLKTSSRLNMDLRHAFESTEKLGKMPKDINYESLLKMAQKSHESRDSVTTSILTRIGQASFLDVSVNSNCIIFTKRREEQLK